MSKPVKWGVLSTAKIGREQVIPAICAAEGAFLHAIASRAPERASTCAARFGATASYGSYEDLLNDPDVEAVYIPLPTSHHAAWSIKALEAGKHVLCEKPIALHADEIGAIKKARESSGCLASEAFMVTYHPQWHKVRDLLAQGAIGRLRHVQGVFSFFTRDETNTRNIVAMGGGALPDIGVYPTVTTRFATGKEPQRVRARVERDATFGTDIFTTAEMDFGDFSLSMMVSTQLALRQEMVFHGETGFISLSTPFNAGLYDADVVTLRNQDHSGEQRFRFSGVNQYKLQIEAFSRAVRGSKEAIFSLEESTLNQRAIDAIYRAGESGGWEQV
ncbi:MAG: Gfo/Idh/MocA family oxidoreductase [Pseudomonadota bacterium]